MRLRISFAMLFSTGYGADFTTYVGGPTQIFYLSTVDALAIDPAGNTYVTGLGGFVTKLDSHRAHRLHQHVRPGKPHFLWNWDSR